MQNEDFVWVVGGVFISHIGRMNGTWEIGLDDHCMDLPNKVVAEDYDNVQNTLDKFLGEAIDAYENKIESIERVVAQLKNYREDLKDDT